MSESGQVEKRRFDVETCLGAGGFGEVYLCTMISPGGLKSKVAVKVLRDGLDPRTQSIRRLRDEAKVLAALSHPSILAVRDLVTLDGRVALVTEYVQGADLDQCLEAKDGLSLRAALEVLARVSEALDASWNATAPDGSALRLVHRDIKPSNIRLGVHGEVKVLDFGIAKFAEEEREAKTKAGQLIGTVSYMAPERLDRAEDHPAGDVYALGAILYELLSKGPKLFEGITAKQQYLWSTIQEKHDSYVEERIAALPKAPPAFLEALRASLAYAPTDRPTAGEFAATLDDLDGEVDGPNLRRWCKAHTWVDQSYDEGDLIGQSLTEGVFSGTASDFPQEPLRPLPAASQAPNSTVSFTDYEDDVPPVSTTSSMIAPAAKAGGVAVGLLGIVGMSIVVALAMAGVVWVLMQPSGEQPPEPVPADQEDPVPEPEEPELPDEEPDETPEREDPTRPPSDEPATPEEPSDTDDGVAEVDPEEDGSGVDACGPLSEFEPLALLGSISGSARSCLSGLMRNPELKNTERIRVGRVVLVDARTQCTESVDYERGHVGESDDCARYDAEQPYFFAELTRSDPDMMLVWSAHQFAKGAWSEAILWATRSLERADQWEGVNRRQNVLRAQEYRARAASKILSATNEDSDRTKARNYAAEWAETTRQYNLDDTIPMNLCAAAAGARELCEKRVTAEVVKESITFLSIPFGAEVTVDGNVLGNTPQSLDLAYGSHTVKMVHDGVTSEKTIEVNVGKAVKWQWRKGEDAWKGSL